jgi:ubiquinone biosynthesis monooxygenase Coq7
LLIEKFFEEMDVALKVLSGVAPALRESPSRVGDGDPLMSSPDKSKSIALMRVNHTGEVCAQALYSGQKIFETDLDVRNALQRAADEELDHLSWTAKRLAELGGAPSRFNLFFYFGSFFLGMAASLPGREISLGFLRETERQVEAHLTKHESELPPSDRSSLKIVSQMRTDEAAHAQTAHDIGAAELPSQVKSLMRSMSQVMIFVSSRV